MQQKNTVLADKTGVSVMANHYSDFLKQINSKYSFTRVVWVRFLIKTWQWQWTAMSSAARCFSNTGDLHSDIAFWCRIYSDSSSNKSVMWGRGRTQDELQKPAPHSKLDSFFLSSLSGSIRWPLLIYFCFKTNKQKIKLKRKKLSKFNVDQNLMS